MFNNYHWINIDLQLFSEVGIYYRCKFTTKWVAIELLPLLMLTYMNLTVILFIIDSENNGAGKTAGNSSRGFLFQE